MIQLLPVTTLDEIKEQREAYMKKLPYAQDLNIEENIWISGCYKIKHNSLYVGYACIDKEKTLWEFYLDGNALIHSQQIFQYMIHMNHIVAAECKTYDHLLLSLCFDFQKKAEGSAYLFRDYAEVDFSMKQYENLTFRLATMEDYPRLSVIDRIAEGIEFFHDLKEDIQNQEVWVFLTDNQLIGAGTCKKIWGNLRYRDIGMVVAEDHRKRGIGTFILIKLKEHCVANGLLPVGGCWYYHNSSKKTLEKAGFISKHRVIRFYF